MFMCIYICVFFNGGSPKVTIAFTTGDDVMGPPVDWMDTPRRWTLGRAISLWICASGANAKGKAGAVG